MLHTNEESRSVGQQKQEEAARKSPECPWCHSTETEFFSLFGQNLLSSQFYCPGCKTVFEAVRWA